MQADFRPCSKRIKNCGMMTKASKAASVLWEKTQTSPLQATLDSKAAVILKQVFDGRWPEPGVLEGQAAASRAP